MRKWLVMGLLCLIFSGIAALFYYNEWKYLQPTPVPLGYKPVAIGSTIPLGKAVAKTGRPVLLHFFNPDCPCSRFNIKHFKSLVKQYGSRVQFVVVIESKKTYTPQEIQSRFGLDMPVVQDQQSLAASCGVYATPQAVLLNKQQQLCYRGNYNTSRYCTNEKTSYARIAIDQLLRRQQVAISNPMAVKAYGCSLPGCSNTLN